MNGIREKELFEKAPAGRAVARLAVPAVIGQIILVAYNMADTFFIGMTGSDAKLTAVTVCMPAFMFLSAVANLFGVGGASAIARALGQKDRERARSASSFAFWGCAAATLLYGMLAAVFLHSFVDLLGGVHDQVHRQACIYLSVTVVAGGSATSMSIVMSHLVRAEGRSVRAAAGIGLGGILNIVLDPLFMFRLLPPGHEVAGAAAATALSNLISLLYFLILLPDRARSSVISLLPSVKAWQPGIILDILGAGLPACLMTLCENISFAVLDKQMSLWGIQLQTGVGVAKKVNMLAHSIVRGMTQGCLPLIGYNYSSGNLRRMKHCLRICTVSSTVIAAACTLCTLLFARPMIGLFIRSDSAAGFYGALFLRILCLGCPFSACAYTFISFFQATGHGTRSLVLALLRKGLLDIPLMFVLGHIFPVRGIVAATPAADVICCCISLLVYALFVRKHAPRSDPGGVPAVPCTPVPQASAR